MKITLNNDITAEQLCSILKNFLTDKYGSDTKFKDINIHIAAPEGSKDFEEWHLCEDKVINLSEDKQAEFIKMVSAHILNEYNMVNHRIATLTDTLKTNQKRLSERQSAEKPRKSLINYSKTRVDTIEKELGELQDRLKILSLMTSGNTLNTHHIKLKRVASRKNLTTLKADFIFEKENAIVTHCIATYSLHDKKLNVEYTDKTPADF